MLARSQKGFRSEDASRSVKQHKMCNEEVEMFGKRRKLELLTLSISGSHVCYLRRTSKRQANLEQTDFDWIFSLA